MFAAKEFVRVFDTLVNRFPLMNESIKVSVHMKRKDIVLFTELFERALTSPELNSLISDETKQALKTTIDEILAKAELKEFVAGLKEFLGSK
jgi:hypothetical protein